MTPEERAKYGPAEEKKTGWQRNRAARSGGHQAPAREAQFFGDDRVFTRDATAEELGQAGEKKPVVSESRPIKEEAQVKPKPRASKENVEENLIRLDPIEDIHEPQIVFLKPALRKIEWFAPNICVDPMVTITEKELIFNGLARKEMGLEPDLKIRVGYESSRKEVVVGLTKEVGLKLNRVSNSTGMRVQNRGMMRFLEAHGFTKGKYKLSFFGGDEQLWAFSSAEGENTHA